MKDYLHLKYLRKKLTIKNKDSKIINNDPNIINKLPYLLLSKFDQWNIDSVKITDEEIEIIGWAILPKYYDYVFGLKNANMTYVFDNISFPYDRTDINDIFWYFDKTKYYVGSFVCKLNMKGMVFAPDSDFEFLIINKNTNQPICNRHNFYFPNYHIDEKTHIKENIKRTTGTDNYSNYVLQGYTFYKNILDILKKYKLDVNNSKILDFGCGSGRVLTHFANNNIHIEGADIDSNNLKLCEKEFKSSKFHLFPLFPPTKLEPDKFDAIFGISVFTHLNEYTQNKWLEELNRIAKKGAYILLSIHSDIAMSRTKADFSDFDKYIYDGFIFSLSDINEIKNYIYKNDYYGTTYHSHKYIYLNWTKFFEIIEIKPGYIGGLQDMVIMQKRQ